MNKKKELYKSIIWTAVAFIVGGLFLMLIYLKTGFYFETIDDVFISDMLKGGVTGQPEYHTFHSALTFTFPLTCLYRINHTAPWYGIAILLMHWLSISLPLTAMYSRCQKLYENIIATFATLLMSALCLKLFSYPQYTSTAMLTAISGFSCLILNKRRLPGLIEFGLMELMAYGIRPEAMELIQPLGFALLLGLLLSGIFNRFIISRNPQNNTDNSSKTSPKSDRLRKGLGYIGIPLAISLGIILVEILIQNIAYSSPEWKQAVSAHESRILLVDYYGFPEADEVSDILETNGVSSEEYVAYTEYLNYSWDSSNGVLEQIADYARQKSKSEANIASILKMLYLNYKNWPWNMYKVLIGAFIVELLAIIIFRKPGALFMNLGFQMAKLISWGYIFYKGRLPDRIITPLYLIELISILIITLAVILDADSDINPGDNKNTATVDIRKTVVKISAVALSFIPLCYFTYRTTQEEYRYIDSQKQSVLIWADMPEEYEAYCNSHPENRYLLAFKDFCYWKRGLLEAYSSDSNYIYGGGWYVTLPDAGKYADNYLNAPNVLFIAPHIEEIDITNQISYLEKKYNCELIPEEYIVFKNGIEYCIYRIH